jgi:hypothetical protein
MPVIRSSRDGSPRQLPSRCTHLTMASAGTDLEWRSRWWYRSKALIGMLCGTPVSPGIIMARHGRGDAGLWSPEAGRGASSLWG